MLAHMPLQALAACQPHTVYPVLLPSTDAHRLVTGEHRASGEDVSNIFDQVTCPSMAQQTEFDCVYLAVTVATTKSKAAVKRGWNLPTQNGGGKEHLLQESQLT